MSGASPSSELHDDKPETGSLPEPHDKLASYWLAAIIDSADDAIITKTLEGVITSWNRGAERIFGYTGQEAIGRPVTLLIPPDHIDEEPAILARLRAGERIEHYETIRVRKDGTRINISLTVSPIVTPEGRIIGASKIARDITERKLAEMELSRSRRQLETVFNNATLALFVMDERQHCTYMNPSAEKLTGYKLGEVQGRPLHYFIHHTRPDGRPYLLEDCPIDQALPQNNQEQGEDVFVHKDGSFYPVAFTASPIRENGRPVGTIIEVRDTTQEKRAAEEKERLYREAQESSRLKDEFLATVSHELRTPLTAILGWAHMLRTGQFKGDSATRACETIERNARAQAQLIDDLLDVSRIITGKLRIDVRPIDPNSFIEAAIEAVRPATEAKGVRLEKIMDTGVVTVSGDPVRLQQVIWNLLSNAIKFTPRSGRVQLRLERVNSHVEIAVSDSGVGIAPEFLPFVFDRFRQADQRTTRQHGGLGLGLAIVRHLVELHGGSVRAESMGEGRGATFTVMLPVTPVYQTVSKEERVHPAARDTLPLYECPERFDGLKILVIDDEPDTRELLKVGLEQCGAEVITVGSADEALKTISVAVPDLLISDIGMPGVDGYDLMRRVRALPADGGGNVPAIALTAYARVEDRMQALRVGYQMHVPKPVELAELIAVAASLVQRRSKTGDS